MKALKISKNLLIEEYKNNKKCMVEISKQYGFSISSISRYLKLYNIELNYFKSKYYCIDCNKEITFDSAKYGKHRCKSCANLGIKNPNFVHGNNCFCIDCNKKLSRYNGKRCKECRKVFLSISENNPNWKNGLSFEKYTKIFNDELKEYIRKRDNYRCQICGKQEKDFKEKLHCHHIDYDKKNCSENNLISLCRSCHIKTNYHREKWINYFRRNMKKFKDPLSRTTLKSRNSNKYNKFERTIPLKDVGVEYNQDPTGWTKKIK